MSQGTPSLETLSAIALPQARRAIGKQGKAGLSGLPCAYIRDLGEEDYPALMEGAQSGQTEEIAQQGITQMTQRHHMLAMVLAGGADAPRAAFVTGYATSTINLLKRSPMFQELLAYYGEQKAVEFQDFHAKVAVVGMEAVDEIARRLRQEPGEIKTKDLLAIAADLMDRTVLPSKGTKGQGGGAAPPAPVTVIQFIDSPHANAPRSEDPRELIDVSYTRSAG